LSTSRRFLNSKFPIGKNGSFWRLRNALSEPSSTVRVQLWTVRVKPNNCIRYVYNLHSRDHVSSHVQKILGSTLEQFLHFRSCLFLFNLLNTRSPLYLYEKLILPRRQRGKLLGLPKKYHSMQYENSFFVLGIHLWNSLSIEVRHLESTSAFRPQCLSYLTLERA
jgi:hypothetical protein